MTILNLSAKHGDTFNGFIIQMTLDGVPLNLNGSVIKMDLKTSTCDVAALSLSSNGGGITIVEAVSGIFQVQPLIIDITPTTYKYDLQITLGDDTVRTPFGGDFLVFPDVTD